MSTLHTGTASPAPALWRVLPLTLAVAVVAGLSIVVTPVGPVAVAGAALLALAVWRRPVVAAVVVAAVVPALSGLGRGLVIPGLKISEVLLLGCAVVVFLRRPEGWRRFSATDAGLGLFAVAGIGFGIYHQLRGVEGYPDMLLRAGLLPAFLFATWWTASRAVRNREDLVLVLRWVLGLSLLPALVGLAQYADVPGVREVLLVTVGEGLLPLPGEINPRVTGPFTIAHSFGGYLIVPVVLATVLLLRGDRTVLRRWQLLTVLAVDVAALVLAVTVTFFFWVPFAVLVAAAVVRRLGRAILLLAVLAAVVGALFSTALDARMEEQTTPAAGTTEGLLPQTVQYRMLVWERDYLPLLSRAAGVGIGIDTPSSVQFDSTENQYLTLVLRGGVGLLLAAVVGLVALGARARRTARSRDGTESAAAATVLGILLFLPFAALIWPYLTNAGFPQSLLGFAGAALAADRWRRATFTGPRYGRPVPGSVPEVTRSG
ncbi:hypothetical protein [Cellulomonas bogoriensis]|uniref:O-antigen polymerase n=1 Tax=Cellulomonas bogoriensis 69B4 = DSM 16987 TaxID=1386082 RepID=A0A0A0BWX5_9CELL|nr:hypothetical protein [Cellulomonas bogoriensis]KGM12172.1 hypothetical protein N869_02080 [Cellulomonas bogoriensis 69B4 = DSM 16987]